MVQRLAEALEGLTFALREFRETPEWEFVAGELAAQLDAATGELLVVTSAAQAPLPVPKAQAKPKAKSAATPVSITYTPATPEIRHYLVLSNPGGGPVGYASGLSPETWAAVERVLPGGRLAGSGARLRRVANREQAQLMWEEHFPGLPLPELLQ